MRFCLVLIAMLLQSAQDVAPPPAAEPTIRTTTHAVLLDVGVIDHHGAPVPGLTENDFVVIENDVPQKIASLEASAASLTSVDEAKSGQVPRPSSKVEPAVSSSQVVIIIDELNTQFVDIAYARYSLEKFLKRNSAKLDDPTELLTLTDEGLKLIHDYTRDGSELLDSLEHMPAKLPFHLSVNGADPDRASISLGALEQTALANVKSNRRTILIWLSPGYPVVDKSDISDPQTRDKFERSVKNLSIELLDARVTIYSIDPRGVIANADEAKNDRLNGLGSSSPFGFGDMALGRLAKETGGHAFYGRNEVDTQVATVLSQSAAFYTLSYYPSNGNYDGKFRRIHVQVKEPELSVQARNGYYAFPDAGGPPSLDQINLAVKRAMFTPLDYKGIPFSALQLNQHGKKSLDLRVDGGALGLNDMPSGASEFHVMVGVGRFVNGIFNIKQFEYRGVLSATDAKNIQDKKVHIDVDQPDTSDAHELRIVLCDLKTGLVGTSTLVR